MEKIKSTLEILHNILDEKYSLLNQVYTIIQNQEMFLKSLSGSQLDEFMKQSDEEKVIIVGQIIKLDEDFLENAEGFNGILNENKDAFKDEIISLQYKIKTILDLDSEIKNLSDSNKNFMKIGSGSENLGLDIKPIRTNKSYILEQYQKNYKKD